MKIGVFDSGIGGLSVARAIEKAFKRDEVIYLNDAENVPYGTKKPDEIYRLVEPKIQRLVDSGCNPIVLACNTVTMTVKPRLVKRFSQVDFVGLDPMIKPAAKATKSQKIVVCATPATLASERYRALK